MITCSKCRCAAYCSIQHLEDDKTFHSKSCKRLQTALQDYRTQQKLKKTSITTNTTSMLSSLIQDFIIQNDRYQVF